MSRPPSVINGNLSKSTYTCARAPIYSLYFTCKHAFVIICLHCKQKYGARQSRNAEIICASLLISACRVVFSVRAEISVSSAATLNPPCTHYKKKYDALLTCKEQACHEYQRVGTLCMQRCRLPTSFLGPLSTQPSTRSKFILDTGMDNMHAGTNSTQNTH